MNRPTSSLEAYRGRRVGVIGMARSGIAVTRALRAVGADVHVFDDKVEALAPALALGARQGRLEDMPGMAIMVASPGIPFTHPAPHPILLAARSAGVEIVGDIELFYRTVARGPIVAITGTNGKSTTSALIHHLLVAAGVPALLGGNIGKAVFDLAPTAEDTLVLELSSYQLDLISTFRPDVAVWLNLTPDHLDRHGSLAGYVSAKRRIFLNQDATDTAVVGVGDLASARLADELAAAGRHVVRIAVEREVEGAIAVVQGRIFDPAFGSEPVADLRGLSALRGAHNWQNAIAAYAALRALDIAPKAIARGFAGFAGLPHRMEEVGRFGRLRFVNDSKATNPDSAAKSLGSFEDIFWIAGGAPKPGGFAALDPFLAAVRHGYFIGEAESELLAAFTGKIPVTGMGTLESALERAYVDAKASGREATILLAPACASFDQFKSYEARGDRFRTLVAELIASRQSAEPVR